MEPFTFCASCLCLNSASQQFLGKSLCDLLGDAFAGACAEIVVDKAGDAAKVLVEKNFRDAQGVEKAIPYNHHLQAAAYRALAASLLILSQSLEYSACNDTADKNWQNDFSQFAKEFSRALAKEQDKWAGDERHKIRSFEEVWQAHFGEVINRNLHIYLDIFQAGNALVGGTGEADHPELGKAFHEAVIIWLGNRLGVSMPDELQQKIRQGFEYLLPRNRVWNDGNLHVTLFDVWAQCCHDNLKTDAGAFRAYAIEMLNRLEVDGAIQQQLLHAIDERLNVIAWQQEAISKQLTALLGLAEQQIVESQVFGLLLRNETAQLTELLIGQKELNETVKSAVQSILSVEQLITDAPWSSFYSLPSAVEQENVNPVERGIYHLRYRMGWMPIQQYPQRHAVLQEMLRCLVL